MIEYEKSDFETLIDFIKKADQETLAIVKDILENPEKHRTKERWSTGDECVFGKVVKEFGNLGEKSFPKKNVFLTEKDDKYEIVIKMIPYNSSVTTSYYDIFSLNEVEKLRHILADAIKITINMSMKKIEEHILEIKSE